MEAQLQKRIDSDSDAKASQSFLAAKVQALEAKVADLEARPSQGIQNWSAWSENVFEVNEVVGIKDKKMVSNVVKMKQYSISFSFSINKVA